MSDGWWPSTDSIAVVRNGNHVFDGCDDDIFKIRESQGNNVRLAIQPSKQSPGIRIGYGMICECQTFQTECAVMSEKGSIKGGECERGDVGHSFECESECGC
jgi:hypothetical protein